MGCCISCCQEDNYEDYEQVHRETERRHLIQLYNEQYAREQAEGVIVLPMHTRVAYIDIDKVRAVFPPTPPRSPGLL
jgi:hypothetical protein